jgi:hypothetical protein
LPIASPLCCSIRDASTLVLTQTLKTRTTSQSFKIACVDAFDLAHPQGLILCVSSEEAAPLVPPYPLPATPIPVRRSEEKNLGPRMVPRTQQMHNRHGAAGSIGLLACHSTRCFARVFSPLRKLSTWKIWEEMKTCFVRRKLETICESLNQRAHIVSLRIHSSPPW